MAYKVTALNVDLVKEDEARASISMMADDNRSNLTVSVLIPTPGNRPENRLRDEAKAAAKAALLAAAAAL